MRIQMMRVNKEPCLFVSTCVIDYYCFGFANAVRRINEHIRRRSMRNINTWS